MKKIIIFKKGHIVCLLITLFTLFPLTLINAATLTDEVTDVPVDKTWTVKFNFPVVESSITPSSIYVMNSKQEKQNVTVSAKDNIVTVHAPATGYEPGQAYTLHITANVLGQIGEEIKALKQPVVKPFSTTEGYIVVNIKKDGTYSPVENYQTYDEANASLQENQGIMLNDKYIKIPSGFVATNKQAVTVLYKQATFTSQYEYTGVSIDTELIYADATANYVKVKAFGQDMYVKHEDVTLIPTVTAKGQSYYVANEQGLWHYIYHHNQGKYNTAYLVGKKPDFLNEGVKYYSTDGINFVDANSKVAGESYNYFQYVSLRIPTSYSAVELDAYIDRELAAKERTAYAKYANATTKSPLKGLGATLKTIEKEHRINALFLLSFAIHESDYGMSCHAQNNNNLFGLNIPDSNDQCSTNGNTSSDKYFASIEENITALVNRLNTNYLDPLNMADYRYNGVALGNKMVGMNVRYASDPYWGAKISGHMYRIDKALGNKDYQKYDVGFTAVSDVSIRKEPVIQNGVNNNRAYQYKLDWTIKRLDKMPVTLSNTPSEAAGWLRVISELPEDGRDLYTVTENVLIVPTH
ncbi:glucosaminidase domain-containing protein [Domibacillus sp. PGB-M46]|uniref:glucosaminidase domain-containing protein n=1 Tax=Domibacillus sp. PGB-M46 TaxID=2910255 RepID=UPI001F57076A|nr:glucosaminidase domain-containing protein [Domibacillus sp. PGB-M46]MCI2254827.1 glucosaminidase domain-containing protein [Domibacillus sp. PGB-M46]